MHVTGAALRL